MASLLSVRLDKGGAPSWGFRLQGGQDFGTPLVIQKVIGGSPADRAGLIAGDTVCKINNVDVYNLRHKDAQDVIVRAGHSFEIAVQRGGSAWKPSVTPVGNVPSPRPNAAISNLSPVTSTSLAAGRQENIGAIGTGHNLAARPFGAQVNGGPRLVNKQYNSPLPIYSDKSIAETISAQSEVLANGVVGVNFKKNEKSYDSEKSAVFRMVQEADKEPSEPDQDYPSSGVVTAPLGIAGLRHVTAPENRPGPPTPHLPPGQNICADCERLIVGVFVRIKDKNLHVECFKCATCGTSLKNVGYYNLNNKLYCDVHAKLAAKNNPPGPNLVPVTIPPGGRIPAGTISSALSSHTLPSPAPLSPNTNYSAPAPYQPGPLSPRPYSNVSAPLSPSSNFLKTSPTPAAPLPENRCVQKNIVWPPLQDEPEFPTASPLYFPPPSQVEPLLKKIQVEPEPVYCELDNQDYCELEEMSYINENRNMSFCSSEVSNITETLSEAINTQLLVDSIKSRPKSPPPKSARDVNVTFTVSESQFQQNTSCNTIASTCEATTTKTCFIKDKSKSPATVKVENAVPQRYDSPMVVALTTASDKPYEANTLQDSADAFSQIPSKTSTSKLASALATAPAEPFTPPNFSLKAVPLPEETVPYFPPERSFVSESTPEQPPSSSGRSSRIGKKKPAPEDEFFKDLPPIPTERISLLTALTTAPERPFTPFSESCQGESPDLTTVEQNERIEEPIKDNRVLASNVQAQNVVKKEAALQNKVEKVEKVEQVEKVNKIAVKQNKVEKVNKEDKSSASHNKSSKTNKVAKVVKKEELKETNSSSEVQQSSATSESMSKNISNIYSKLPPMIQSVRSSYETKTDKVQMELSCQFIGEPTMRTEITEKSSTQSNVSEDKSVHKTKKESKKISKSSKVDVEKDKENQMWTSTVSNVSSTNLLNEAAAAASVSNVSTTKVKEQAAVATESCLLQRATKEVDKITKEVKKEGRTTPKRVTIIKPGEENLHIPKISFQPVSEDRRPNTTFSPRPVTPSGFNKPAPVIPYYQASLVAMDCLPVSANKLDPTTPTGSRSPSPYLGRSTSPFPSTTIRPVSPAQGPPCNPLASPKSASEIMYDNKRDDARAHLASFIPQHQLRLGGNSISKVNPQTDCMNTCAVQRNRSQNVLATCQKTLDVESVCQQTSNSKSFMEKKELHQAANLEAKKVDVSKCGNVEIQKSTKVTEEYERLQKSVVIQSEKSSTTLSSGQTQNQGVVGLHITNPQPLKSPFVQKGDSSDKCSINSTPSNIPKKISSSNISGIPKPFVPSSGSIPSNTDNSNKNLTTPNVSQPNVGTGTGGGRQTGAIGVAPRRGRGVLNLAAAPGSRVPLCAQCHNHIRGPFISALGKIWCPDHFICATPSCRRPLQDLGFVEEKGQLYCEYCFEQYLAPPCAKCNAKIKGDCLKAIGKNFHPECFNCVYCGKLFGNSPFFLEDCQPYCEADWNELFTTKCFACGFPVEAGDRWVEALSNNYHSQCFNCTMCKKNLEGQSFFAKGGRPFCKNHAR